MTANTRNHRYSTCRDPETLKCSALSGTFILGHLLQSSDIMAGEDEARLKEPQAVDNCSEIVFSRHDRVIVYM